MFRNLRLNLSIALLFIYFSLDAQPAYIFEGGVGGGFSSMLSSVVYPYFYEGGFGDGYMLAINTGSNAYFYYGGEGDGFAHSSFGPASIYIYEGGLNSGYASDKEMYQGVTIYEGGIKSGYSSDKEMYQGVTIYEGGINQGYDLHLKREDFIWTGTVGTGWAISGNWNFNMIPDISRPVVIPSGVPHYPHLNAGIFAIGDNPNNGSFVCNSLWIQDGALLVTRINSFVENYGEVQIEGSMQVKNSAPTAFQNLAGNITISGTGLLLIKP